MQEFTNSHLKDIESGALKPEVYKAPTVSWSTNAEEVFQQFHTEMEANENIGKFNIVFDDWVIDIKITI